MTQLEEEITWAMLACEFMGLDTGKRPKYIADKLREKGLVKI